MDNETEDWETFIRSLPSSQNQGTALNDSHCDHDGFVNVEGPEEFPDPDQWLNPNPSSDADLDPGQRLKSNPITDADFDLNQWLNPNLSTDVDFNLGHDQPQDLFSSPYTSSNDQLVVEPFCQCQHLYREDLETSQSELRSRVEALELE